MYTATIESGKPYAEDMFKDSEMEIFTLMERDTWARLKGDADMVCEYGIHSLGYKAAYLKHISQLLQVRSMAKNYFFAADTNHDGVISYAEYQQWASANPQATLILLEHACI